jgi:hypothetical protein
VITALAFVPSTPLLVPEAGRGAAYELDGVRDASYAALARALRTAPERVVVIGAGAVTRELRSGLGTLRGFGIGYDVPLDPATPSAEELPLALTLGAWLLATAGWAGERAALELDPAAGRPTLASVATALAGEPFRSVLLVVADGSAARTEKAPAALHPDAAAFDADVAAALTSGRPHDLTTLDPDRARSVTAAGWPAWFTAATAAGISADGAWDAVLHADEAPYGVGYLVASWLRP